MGVLHKVRYCLDDLCCSDIVSVFAVSLDLFFRVQYFVSFPACHIVSLSHEHTHAHTPIYSHTNACMHTCAYTHAHTYTHVHMCTHTFTYMHMCMHAQTHTHTGKHTCMRMHTHIHTYSHILTYRLAVVTLPCTYRFIQSHTHRLTDSHDTHIALFTCKPMCTHIYLYLHTQPHTVTGMCSHSLNLDSLYKHHVFY